MSETTFEGRRLCPNCVRQEAELEARIKSERDVAEAITTAHSNGQKEGASCERARILAEVERRAESEELKVGQEALDGLADWLRKESDERTTGNEAKEGGDAS